MRQQSSERGFVLAAVLFFITATAVVLATLIPSYIMEAKRDREDELIFRGAEYARAIKKFQTKYGALPLTVDELMMGSDGIPSLRKHYLDPTTGEEFRPIYVQTDGTLQGSNLYLTLRDAITNTSTSLADSAAALADEAAANGGTGDTTGAGNGANTPNAGGIGNSGTNLTTNQGTNLTGGQAAANTLRNNQGTNLLSNQGTSLTNPGQTTTPATTTNAGATTGGTPTQQAGLVGVASQNDKMSVKKYVGQDRYINWEFIANVRRTVNRGATNTAATGNTNTNTTTGGAAGGIGNGLGAGTTGGGGFTGGTTGGGTTGGGARGGTTGGGGGGARGGNN